MVILKYLFTFACKYKKFNLMKKLILWALTLTLLMFSSCGDDELATIPNIKDNPVSESVESEQDIFAIPESAIVVNYVPSYVTEALNNAKVLFDDLGEINETKTDNIHYYVKDDKSNIFVIDTLGNIDIRTSAKGIHIDSSVRENSNISDNTICNTIWKGWGNNYIRYKDVELPTLVSDTTFSFYGAEYEDSVFYRDISHDITYEPTSGREIKFKNTTCILTAWDTVRVYNKETAIKCRRVKVKEQECSDHFFSYKIEIKEDTLYVYLLSDNGNASLVDTEELDSEGYFTRGEAFQVIRKDLIETKTYNKCVAYNYKRNNDGKILLYDNNYKYEPYYWVKGKFGFSYWIGEKGKDQCIDVHFTKVSE